MHGSAVTIAPKLLIPGPDQPDAISPVTQQLQPQPSGHSLIN